MSISLYELKGNWVTVKEMMENEELDMGMLKDTLEGIDGEIEDKADNYARIIKSLDSESKIIKEEEDRLKARRTSLDNKIKWLKTNLEQAMIATEKRKFKTPFFSFGIQKNGASLRVSDSAKIPEAYYIPQDPKLDSRKLKEDVKNGLEIEGVSLEQTESIRIR